MYKEVLSTEVLKNKDLKISIAKGCKGLVKNEIKEMKENDKIDTEIFIELFESQLCNGFRMVAPEEIGALTSCDIILTDDYTEYGDDEVNDSGHYDDEIKSLETCWWQPNYMVESVIDLLLKDGYFILENGMSEVNIEE
jgi:hypothetical protein